MKYGCDLITMCQHQLKSGDRGALWQIQDGDRDKDGDRGNWVWSIGESAVTFLHLFYQSKTILKLKSWLNVNEIPKSLR